MDIDIKKLLPVLIGIHLVAIPFYSRIQPIILFILFALTLWGFLIIDKRVKQPSDLVRVITLIFSVFFLITANGTLFGQQASTSLLFLLSLLKIFEVKTRRDVNVIIFMCYFIIASNFFFTQSPLIALYVFAIVIYLSSVLIYLSDTGGTINFSGRLTSASKIVAIAIPFMLILFILFPRIPSPLWGLPNDALTAKMGLGDDLTLGSINRLVSSGEVAFRVDFEDEAPPHNILYWRGPVLSLYDGKTWSRDDAPSTAKANLILAPEPHDFNYTITLEPHNKNWLLSLEHPTAIEPGTRLSRELQLINHKRVTNVISYTLKSSVNTVNAGLFEQEVKRNLNLPSKLNPKTRLLALQFYHQADGDPERIVKNVLAHFRQQEFFYTLAPPLLGKHSMDNFLFDTKRGFCGHYASAFVTLMRNTGIPSRVITGYQGGVINPVDNYMIVRQSDAHAWAEVWINNKGWIRIDPTAAVSPARIESGISSAGLESDRLPAILLTENILLTQSRYIFDSIQNSWNKWIIGYNQQQQIQLFNFIGFEKVDSTQLVLWLVFAMTLSGAIIAGFLLRSSPARSDDKILYYYHVFCRKLKHAGLERPGHEGEDEFLNKIKLAFPKCARAAEIITYSYQQIRYNDHADPRYQNNFIRVVKNFKVIKS